MIVALGQRQAGNLGGMVVVRVRRHRVGAPVGAVEIEMQVVAGAAGQFGMRQLHAVVSHGNDGARATRDRPGRAQVEIDSQRSSVGVAILQVPLVIKIRIIWPGGVRAVQSDLQLPPDRTTHQHLWLVRQPLGEG